MAHKNVDYKPEDIQFPNQKIVQSELVHEMQSSYIEYAMSVIVSRAIPEIDGFFGASSIERFAAERGIKAQAAAFKAITK